MMNRIAALAAAVGLCAILTGCTQSLPLISHAHVGHALTAWRDTPGQQGLFVIAEKETRIALEQAKLGVQSDHTPALVTTRLQNSLHALNPDLHAPGPGLGYGALRALTGAIDHIEFAARSDDASQNIKRGSARFAEHARQVLDRMALSVDVARLADQAAPAELPGLAEELSQLLTACLNGIDRNNDGRFDAANDELGLAQIRTDLSKMIANEKPPYHPLGRRYLLGLIRLPSGRWAYDFNHVHQTDSGY